MNSDNSGDSGRINVPLKEETKRQRKYKDVPLANTRGHCDNAGVYDDMAVLAMDGISNNTNV